MTELPPGVRASGSEQLYEGLSTPLPASAWIGGGGGGQAANLETSGFSELYLTLSPPVLYSVCLLGWGAGELSSVSCSDTCHSLAGTNLMTRD